MPDAIHYPYGEEPKRLQAGENLTAYRVGRYYSLTLPQYSREATEIIRMVATAHWERSDGAWHVHASHHQTLQRAMDQVAVIPGMDRAPGPRRATVDTQVATRPQRSLIPADADFEVGQILTYRRKPVAVERLGAPFMADSRNAKWGKPELAGKMVRYAYHHPASQEEVHAWERTLEDRRQALEVEQLIDEATPEPEF